MQYKDTYFTLFNPRKLNKPWYVILACIVLPGALLGVSRSVQLYISTNTPGDSTHVPSRSGKSLSTSEISLQHSRSISQVTHSATLLKPPSSHFDLLLHSQLSSTTHHHSQVSLPPYLCSIPLLTFHRSLPHPHTHHIYNSVTLSKPNLTHRHHEVLNRRCHSRRRGYRLRGPSSRHQ